MANIVCGLYMSTTYKNNVEIEYYLHGTFMRHINTFVKYMRGYINNNYTDKFSQSIKIDTTYCNDDEVYRTNISWDTPTSTEHLSQIYMVIGKMYQQIAKYVVKENGSIRYVVNVDDNTFNHGVVMELKSKSNFDINKCMNFGKNVSVYSEPHMLSYVMTDAKIHDTIDLLIKTINNKQKIQHINISISD